MKSQPPHIDTNKLAQYCTNNNYDKDELEKAKTSVNWIKYYKNQKKNKEKEKEKPIEIEEDEKTDHESNERTDSGGGESRLASLKNKLDKWISQAQNMSQQLKTFLNFGNNTHNNNNNSNNIGVRVTPHAKQISHTKWLYVGSVSKFW